MEHLGNKVTFAADEVDTYGVGLDGALTVTLKHDVRTDPSQNMESDMPKISADGIPSYEGHEGAVQSASGLLYDVATDKPDPIGSLDGRVVGEVGQRAEDKDAEREQDEDRSDDGTDSRTLGDEGGKQDDTGRGHVTPVNATKPAKSATPRNSFGKNNTSN
jgi:hypothetical protein